MAISLKIVFLISLGISGPSGAVAGLPPIPETYSQQTIVEQTKQAVALAEQMEERAKIEEDEKVAREMAVNSEHAAQNRQRAVAGLRAKAQVRKIPFQNAQSCLAAARTYQSKSFQMFAHKSTGKAELFPMQYDYMGTRVLIDEERAAKTCKAKSPGTLLVYTLPEKDLRADERLQKDYVLVLRMAEWAQGRLDGTLDRRRAMEAIPDQVDYDVLNVLPTAIKP